jgi:pyruvate/oxaloacetate carboxyltransferase
MLLKLLEEIDRHPFASVEQLGQMMGIPVELVVNMVADLTKRGYLNSYENCVSACDHCALSTACEGKQHPKIWTISEKGRQMACRQNPGMVQVEK